MASILDLLSEQGLSVQAVSSGRTIDPDVRAIYDALKEGCKYVYLFTSDASEGLLEVLASAEDVTDGSALVMMSHNGDDVATLRRKVDYRNSNNIGKDGKPRAKVTLGACALSHNIVEGVDAVGFRISAA